jgi:hypothetical protein
MVSLVIACTVLIWGMESALGYLLLLESDLYGSISVSS